MIGGIWNKWFRSFEIISVRYKTKYFECFEVLCRKVCGVRRKRICWIGKTCPGSWITRPALAQPEAINLMDVRHDLFHYRYAASASQNSPHEPLYIEGGLVEAGLNGTGTTKGKIQWVTYSVYLWCSRQQRSASQPQILPVIPMERERWEIQAGLQNLWNYYSLRLHLTGTLTRIFREMTESVGDFWLPWIDSMRKLRSSEMTPKADVNL